MHTFCIQFDVNQERKRPPYDSISSFQSVSCIGASESIRYGPAWLRRHKPSRPIFCIEINPSLLNVIHSPPKAASRREASRAPSARSAAHTAQEGQALVREDDIELETASQERMTSYLWDSKGHVVPSMNT